MSLHHGDCLEEMAAMDAGSVDAVVCDPPYGLEFMGKKWDRLGDVGKGSAGFAPGMPAVKGVRGAVKALPQYNASGNARCRNCGKWKWGHKDGDSGGGGKGCQCDAPDFPNVKAIQAATMQDWHQAWATEALRVLKPSHYLLAFGGTRTWHRLACAIEDAGFEIRDTLMWIYGSGFPKGKSCLKPAWEPIILARKPGPMRELGIEECRVAYEDNARHEKGGSYATRNNKHAIFGHDLDQATEPSPSGRWPANLILECTCDETREGTAKTPTTYVRGSDSGNQNAYAPGIGEPAGATSKNYGGPHGKEPVRIHTDPNCPCAMLDGQTGTLTTHSIRIGGAASIYGGKVSADGIDLGPGDSGGASRFFYQAKGDDHDPLATEHLRSMRPRMGSSDAAGGALALDDSEMQQVRCRQDVQGPDQPVTRFFYCAKASRSERDEGLWGGERRNGGSNAGGFADDVARGQDRNRPSLNHHPTVKPLALMRWLVKLVAQPGDVVLDPFMGSGTTGVACVMEGREFVGIEREAEYLEIARRRIEHAGAQTRLPVG